MAPKANVPTTQLWGREVHLFLPEVVNGYLVTTDGRVWSRRKTRGGLRENWRPRSFVQRPGHTTPFVTLSVVNQAQPGEYGVALLLVRASSPVPIGLYKGWDVRYRDGDPRNCSLANIQYGPLPKPKALIHRGFDGKAFAADDAKLVRRGFSRYELPI